MGVQHQIEQMPGYLVAKFSGAGMAEDVWRQYDSLAEHCNRTNKDKLLIDITEAQAEISLWDRYFLGDRAQIFACRRIKVAGVDRPERIDPQRFAEMVAQNRGVNARAFTNAEDALEWLLKG